VAVTREGGDPGAALSRADREALTESFKAAYREGLLRGLPLLGVLGGDQVHLWPPAAPLTWVQNWRTAAPRPNSWGLPGLILALRGFDSPRVSIISGPILDFYGQSGGINGANGAAGYGPPRGNAFYFEGGQVQEFARGFIRVDREGKAAFIPGEEDLDASESSRGQDSEKPRTLALLRAAPWAAAPVPEIPERYLSLGAWPLDFAGTRVLVRGIFLRFFEESRRIEIHTEIRADFRAEIRLEIRLDAPELSLPAVILRGPFLEALLSSGRARLPGAEALSAGEFPLPPETEGLDPTTRALLQGMALYGLPLTEEMPLDDPLVYEPSGREAPVRELWVYEPPVRELPVRAQRFSKGWLILEAEDAP
jgi:hypothetical protein